MRAVCQADSLGCRPTSASYSRLTSINNSLSYRGMKDFDCFQRYHQGDRETSRPIFHLVCSHLSQQDSFPFPPGRYLLAALSTMVIFPLLFMSYSSLGDKLMVGEVISGPMDLLGPGTGYRFELASEVPCSSQGEFVTSCTTDTRESAILRSQDSAQKKHPSYLKVYGRFDFILGTTHFIRNLHHSD
ncbi:hypothetical protein PoB_004791400 [Plakobranchus ocellatus]|uniref:Uncharacterized protein n=1 Tax=Plakobranchus ocellatus TaxID=259542 RepID=A0AAV4BMR4_9GAST|nr:hypothetical protein PoB_004791400 [Plakobranchus ocellatus]